MFPLAHNLLIERLLQRQHCPLQGQLTPFTLKLLRVGSIMPDLVSGMGMDRNFGHTMGQDLFAFCRRQYPEALPFALGTWLHGADPCGFDYYADEHWEGQKGWCFQKCQPYIPRVVAACNLPPEWGLWKSHNFVEMSAELEAIAAHPNLSDVLLEARNDPQVQAVVTDILVEFAGAEADKVPKMLTKVDEIFALKGVTAESLAEKYELQMVNRHNIHGGDANQMAAIILDMQQALRQEFWQWLEQVEALIQQALQQQQLTA